MMNDKDWNELMVEHGLAYLRGDLATSSPESYTVGEMKAISDGLFTSTAEVEAAMREDFQGLPPHAQAMLLNLLQQADSEHFGWWMQVLIGDMPESPEAASSPQADPSARNST